MSQSKLITFIVPSLQVGGVERHLSYIAPALKELGWSVRIITLSSEKIGDFTTFFREQGIAVNTLPKFFELNKGPELLKIGVRLIINFIRLIGYNTKNRDGIQHYFLPAAYIVGSMSAKFTFNRTVKVMSRRSMNYYQKNRPLLRRVEYMLHNTNDLVLGNSLRVVNQLRDEESVAVDKLKLIYNGTIIPSKSKLNKANIIKELSIDSNSFIICIVANLIPYKGHFDLIEALAKIDQASFSNWTLLIVGRDDGLANKLKAFARDKGLSKNIRYLGLRSDVSEILHISHVGVLCSHEEGFSNAVLEYMAHGLPSVVTDVGGNAEAVIDGVCGLVVPTKSPKELGKAILWMYKNTDKANEFGQNALKRAKEHFSLQACVGKYDAIYTTLVEGKKLGCGVMELDKQ